MNWKIPILKFSKSTKLNRWAIFNRYVELPEGRSESTKLRIYRPTANGAVGICWARNMGCKKSASYPAQEGECTTDLVPSGNKHRHGPRNGLNWFEGNSTRNLCSKPSNTSSPSIDKSSSSQRHTCNMGDMGFHNVNASRLSCLYVPKTARIPWDTSLILNPQLSKTILTPASVIGMIEPNSNGIFNLYTAVIPFSRHKIVTSGFQKFTTLGSPSR